MARRSIYDTPERRARRRRGKKQAKRSRHLLRNRRHNPSFSPVVSGLLGAVVGAGLYYLLPKVMPASVTTGTTANAGTQTLVELAVIGGAGYFLKSWPFVLGAAAASFGLPYLAPAAATTPAATTPATPAAPAAGTSGLAGMYGTLGRGRIPTIPRMRLLSAHAALPRPSR